MLQIESLSGMMRLRARCLKAWASKLCLLGYADQKRQKGCNRESVCIIVVVKYGAMIELECSKKVDRLWIAFMYNYDGKNIWGLFKFQKLFASNGKVIYRKKTEVENWYGLSKYSQQVWNLSYLLIIDVLTYLILLCQNGTNCSFFDNGCGKLGKIWYCLTMESIYCSFFADLYSVFKFIGVLCVLKLWYGLFGHCQNDLVNWFEYNQCDRFYQSKSGKSMAILVEQWKYCKRAALFLLSANIEMFSLMKWASKYKERNWDTEIEEGLKVIVYWAGYRRQRFKGGHYGIGLWIATQRMKCG